MKTLCLLIACAVAAGCGTLRPHTLARPQPADAMILCERLGDLRDPVTLDDLARWAGITIEQYNRCAARHKALVDYNK